ncbi:TPA: DUF551 domain-containing protein [Citrobacter koseri]
MINTDNIPARDRLFKIAYGSEAHPEEIEQIALALLALIDAKPVAWQWLYYKQWHVTNDEERARDVACEGKVEVQPLYTVAMLQHQPQNGQQNIPEIIPRWVPVSERMPERGVDVLVYCADTKEQMVGYMERNGTEGWFRFSSLPNGGGIYCNPTHWMPLSAAPQ